MTISTPRCLSACMTLWFPPASVMTMVGATLTSHRWRSRGMSQVRVSTTRAGMWPVCLRVVRCGLSLRSVSPPMITASDCARRSCTAPLDVGPGQRE